MDKYIDYNKCKLNFISIEQTIELLNMDDVKETKECSKQDIFNGIKNILIYNGFNFNKFVEDYKIKTIY